MSEKAAILESVQQALKPTHPAKGKLAWQRDLGGGDINQAALITDGKRRYFLKYHVHAPTGMFEAEAAALKELASLDCIRVPRPLALGITEHTDWLLLEYIEFGSAGSDRVLGEQLAALHQHDFGRYGWGRDNFIGSTPQYNSPSDHWATFWSEQRLTPQLKIAESNGFGGRLQTKGAQLLEAMPLLLGDHRPVASLLHGDLWAGNKAFDSAGQAVIFDPASYYGDHEADLAMTELFGGYSQEFYAAYHAHTPMDEGYRLRCQLYNLYHILNHLNLFGSGYLHRSENMIDSLLSQVN